MWNLPIWAVLAQLTKKNKQTEISRIGVRSVEMVGGAKYRVLSWLDCSGFVCVMFRLNFITALMAA